MYIIYMAKNKITGQSYVGRTSSKLSKRISWHYSNSKHRHNKMTNALREFERTDFEWVVLAHTESKEESYRLEAEFIRSYDTLNTGYNSKEGDLIPWNKGKKMTEEYCRRLQGKGNGMYGKTHTKEYRRWRSDHMSKSQLGAANHMAKRVYCVELGKTWDTVKSCSEELHIHKDGISHCCRGVHSTAGGYHFKYV